MAELFWSFDYVTSLVDFYGFMDKDNDAPCQLERRINNAVGQRIQSSWDETRVFAYVQLYEFEALLFSDVHSFSVVFDDLPDGVLAQLRKVRRQFQFSRGHQRQQHNRTQQADKSTGTRLQQAPRRP